MPFYKVSPEALDDLQLIGDFIALDSVEAAERVIAQFFETFEQLVAWPKTGHVRTDLTSKKVRFWPVGSYLWCIAIILKASRSSLYCMALEMCLPFWMPDEGSLG